MALKRKRSGKQRGSSNAGRKKKPGARYPSGGLRPISMPNARVLEGREALLGAKPGDKVDITKASNPLDLAYERGWLSEAEHRAAMSFARIYRRSGIRAPSISGMDHHEVEEAIAVNARSFATMSDTEITEVFDAIFCDDSAPGDQEADAAKSMDLWGKINRQLPPEIQAELFGVCIMGSWPQWVVYRAADKAVPEAWERRRKRLLAGLAHVRAVLRANAPKKAAPIIVETAPEHRRYTGPKVIETLFYVNENGDPIQTVASETGRPFIVERKVPARA